MDTRPVWSGPASAQFETRPVSEGGRAVAAIRAATITAEQMFGEWTLLQEFEKPLCKLTLSNASAGTDGYDFTASFMAWAAQQEITGTGALGPVEAFGLERLEEGARLAGLARVT